MNIQNLLPKINLAVEVTGYLVLELGAKSTNTKVQTATTGSNLIILTTGI
jgi:hypothetical protein